LIGIDSDLLIAFEVSSDPRHATARAVIAQLAGNGEVFAITPHVIAEFVHVATDPKRFSQCLSVAAALQKMDDWQSAAEVKMVYPDEAAVRLFLQWMSAYQLGRKRVLDTLLAATFVGAGLTTIATFNQADFAVFKLFQFVNVP
jgi:predicted nucleic acid-binding protein